MFILFMILLLSSCKAPISQEISLAACGSFSIPGMYCYELKGGSFNCEVLETDVQGRCLFAYSTWNEITEQEETAYVICQKYNQEQVSFYEGMCYTFENDSQQEFKELKELNDWNCDLDESKMTNCFYSVSFDLFLYEEE